MQELKLPELGENVATAEISKVLVSKGDLIVRDQAVIEAETDKASFEVPSEIAGTVVDVLVHAGETVAVGQPILRIESEDGSDGAAVTQADDDGPEDARRDDEAEHGRPEAVAVQTGENEREERLAEPRKEATAPTIGPTVPAAPSVRALARELGVDILRVSGSGPGGRISAEDVKRHARRLIERGGEGPSSAVGVVPAAELPDFARWGEIERVALSGVRRATARAMAHAWAQVPHVTQSDRADITGIEASRRQFNARSDVGGAHLTWTAILVKVCALALRRFPQFNASLDLADASLILKKYVHIGVAVDTERGLLVPVARDVDRKGFAEVARELADLAGRARDKKIMPDEMQGASFTVTNLGGLGTTYFSPIVNWPEVAILGAGAAESVLKRRAGELESRLILPLSLSYDHRAVDGADAARFLRWIAETLEHPFLMVAGS